MLARAVAGLDLGTQWSDVDVPLTGGPSRAAHPSFSCAVVFIEIAASWKLSPKFQGDPSDSRQTDGDHTHTLRRWPALLHGKRDAAESRKAVRCPLLAPPKQNTQVQVFRLRRHGAQKRQRNVRRQAGSRPLLRSVNAKPNSRQQCSLTGRCRCQAGRPRSQWSCSHANTVQFEPCDVGDSCCFAKVKQPSASRGSHPAWSRCRHQSHPSSCQANSCGPTKRRSTSSPTSRPCRSTCKAGCSSGQAQKLPFTGGRVRSGSRCGNNGNEVHRGSQWRRIRRKRAPATGRPCPRAAPSAHQSRMLWSYHCGRRDESAGRSDESSRKSSSWQRNAKEHPLHHCGHFRTLRRVIVMVAGAIDEGRSGGFERQHAMLCQIYGMLESAAKDSGHDMP